MRPFCVLRSCYLWNPASALQSHCLPTRPTFRGSFGSREDATTSWICPAWVDNPAPPALQVWRYREQVVRPWVAPGGGQHRKLPPQPQRMLDSVKQVAAHAGRGMKAERDRE
jgi:hypothetical protein